MFDHLTNPVLIDTRAAVRRFIDEELRPLERELGLGTEDPWPREVLRKVWRRLTDCAPLSRRAWSMTGVRF